MRFVSFQLGDEVGLAVVLQGNLFGLLSGDANYPGDLQDVIAGGPEAIAQAAIALKAGRAILADEIVYRPVLAASKKIACVGLNYRDHSAESGFKQPDYPAIFARFPSSLIGHGTPIIRPKVSKALDYEGELAVIIGKKGRQISEEDALDWVAGYSIFNDASIRDFQHKTAQWTVGKNFDSTGSFGPEFVTSDELPDGGYGLKIETRLNGQTVQSANTSDMVFSVPRLIAIISEAMTLEPGDVIVSGTPAGVGHARTPPLYMKDGDVCEVEIEGLGILRNPVVDEDAVFAS